jgi:hypothetical protein
MTFLREMNFFLGESVISFRLFRLPSRFHQIILFLSFFIVFVERREPPTASKISDKLSKSATTVQPGGVRNKSAPLASRTSKSRADAL